jgi:hypothetical protein
MHLEAYVCQLCLIEREESLRHLFFRCIFAKKMLDSNWKHNTILASADKSSKKNKKHLKIPFAMEIVIITC